MARTRKPRSVVLKPQSPKPIVILGNAVFCSMVVETPSGPETLFLRLPRGGQAPLTPPRFVT